MDFKDLTPDQDRDHLMGRRPQGGGIPSPSPRSQSFGLIQTKARGVLDGTHRFTDQELQEAIAVLILANA